MGRTTVGQRVVETAPEKSSLGPGSGGKSKEISCLATVIDSAARVSTRVVAQGCFSMRKLVCAAFSVIFYRKINRIDENPLGFRPARAPREHSRHWCRDHPSSHFLYFSNFSAQKIDCVKTKLPNSISSVRILVLG